MHEKDMKKQRERAANDKEYDTVNIQLISTFLKNNKSYMIL